jgi:hypothetical protein
MALKTVVVDHGNRFIDYILRCQEHSSEQEGAERASDLLKDFECLSSTLPEMTITRLESPNSSKSYEDAQPAILAGPKYPSTRHVVPLFEDKQERIYSLTNIFNTRMKSAHQVVADTFEMCKRRFKGLHVRFGIASQKQAYDTVSAILLLHNFSLDPERVRRDCNNQVGCDH